MSGWVTQHVAALILRNLTLTTLDFEGIAASGGFVNFFNATGLTVDGVNFQTSGTGPFEPGFVTVMGAAYAAAQSHTFNLGTGAILTWRPSDQPLSFYGNGRAYERGRAQLSLRTSALEPDRAELGDAWWRKRLGVEPSLAALAASTRF